MKQTTRSIARLCVACLAGLSLLAPTSAGAQTPPAPPAPPAPAALPAPAAPPPAPQAPRVARPPTVVIKRSPDGLKLDRDLQIENLERDMARLAQGSEITFHEQERAAMAELKAKLDTLHERAIFGDGPFELQGSRIGGPVAIRLAANDAYARGLGQIQMRQYDRAIESFDQTVAQKSARSDGALYWKAFAQARLVKTEDALTTLTALRRDFPQSRYLNDARVLEADVRKMSGQRIDPQVLAADDEIKLLAINGIAYSDPNQAIPLLETVLNNTNNLAMKKRAVYVLALIEDPRARELLLRYARGGGNPEVQLEAIRYLATSGDKNPADLTNLYGNQDPQVRRAVIQALASQNNAEALVAIARKETDLDLKRETVRRLSEMANRKNKVAADYLMEIIK